MERVPQYIDVEDHIIGPFGWKQLGWFFGAGALLLLLWNVLEKGAFWIASVPIMLIATALAFWRPEGVPLINFIGYTFSFVMRPKRYLWQRDDTITHHKEKPRPREKKKEKPLLSVDEITAVTQTLDTHGQARNDRIAQIIRKRQHDAKQRTTQ